MPDIFASKPGSILQVKTDAGALPFQISMAGWDGYATQRAIITSIGMHQSANYQFLHTLRNFVFIYVFGEKIADLVISGVCFLNPCDGVTTGFEQVYNYYQNNRLSRSSSPVKIVIGTTIVLEGFLTECDVQANNPADMIGQFVLKFSYLPDQGN